MAPENAKAVSFARTGRMAYAAAPRSLSRTATPARPARPPPKVRARAMPEADLPGPSGEDDERDGDDGVQRDVRQQDHACVRQPERHEDRQDGECGEHPRPPPAHLGQVAKHGGNGSDLAYGDIAAES